MKPQPTDGTDRNFGVRFEQLHRFVPPYKDIPPEFRHPTRPSHWVPFVERLFFEGGSFKHLKERPDVERAAAIGHIATVLRTINPNFGHEHKIAGCAYLCSLWFEEVPSSGD